MEVMGMAEATAALREHVMVARVAYEACSRLSTLAAPGVGEFYGVWLHSPEEPAFWCSADELVTLTVN